MNLPTLLPIGAFSAATQLSAKALRLYAEHGILSPAKIDMETGYRYYRPDQVQQARLVRLLRELDMPLTEIARMLVRPDALDVLLKQHMNYLSLRHKQQQTAYRATLALLHPKAVSAAAVITQRTRPVMQVLTRSFEADSHTLLPRAQALLQQTRHEVGERVIDSDACFIHLPAPLSMHDEITAELCVPVGGTTRLPGTCTTRNWPTQALACVNVSIQNDTPDWIAASDALFDWFDRNGVSLNHAPLIFIVGPAPELAWPIF
jgi:DNA-binding transcriptional MerR regulator